MIQLFGKEFGNQPTQGRACSSDMNWPGEQAELPAAQQQSQMSPRVRLANMSSASTHWVRGGPAYFSSTILRLQAGFDAGMFLHLRHQFDDLRFALIVRIRIQQSLPGGKRA